MTSTMMNEEAYGKETCADIVGYNLDSLNSGNFKWAERKEGDYMTTYTKKALTLLYTVKKGRTFHCLEHDIWHPQKANGATTLQGLPLAS